MIMIWDKIEKLRFSKKIVIKKLARNQSCDADGHCQQESQNPVHVKVVSWVKDQD